MERNVKSRNLAEGTVKIRTFNNTLSSCGDPWFIFICMCTTSKKKKKKRRKKKPLLLCLYPAPQCKTEEIKRKMLHRTIPYNSEQATMDGEWLPSPVIYWGKPEPPNGNPVQMSPPSHTIHWRELGGIVIISSIGT